MNKSKTLFNKRLLAIVISFALVLVSVASLTLLRTVDVAHADLTDSWTDTGNYERDWYDEHQSGDYVLNSAEDFAGFAYLVNNVTTFKGKMIKLGADIDLDGHYWTPIGTEEHKFMGTFDGQEHTISNMTVNATIDNAGLFGYVSGDVKNMMGMHLILSYARIKNVTLASNCRVTSTADNVGGIVGMADDGTTIENVSNGGAVNGQESVGGIVGMSNTSLSIKDATNNGQVSGTGNFVGGIVGKANANGDDVSIENVSNGGAVSGVDCVGGIVGINSEKLSIKNAINNGNVTGTLSNIGGIVGKAENELKIENSENSGEVTGTGDGTDNSECIGGIVGYNVNGCSIKNVVNTGIISGSGARIGGIVGASGSVSIENATNSGSVTGESDNVGGIIGLIDGEITDDDEESVLINCNNTAEISGTNSVGGLVGYNGIHKESVNVAVAICNSYNLGSITASETDAGGIFGKVSNNTTATIVNCYNAGEITGNGYKGGIVGSNSGTLTIDSVYYLDNIADALGINVTDQGATTGTATQMTDVNMKGAVDENSLVSKLTEYVNNRSSYVTYGYNSRYALKLWNATDDAYPTLSGYPLNQITATYNGNIPKGNKIGSDDIIITARYSDDSKATISATDESVTYSINGTPIADITTHRFMYEVGTVAEVTVSYNGQEAEMNITVVEPIVTEIAVIYNGGDIAKGNKIQGDDIVITATYSDDSTATISATDGSVTYSIKGNPIADITTKRFMYEVGTVAVTVSYNGQNDTMNINVVDPILIGIEVTYNGGYIIEGEKIQGDKIVITATYSDDSTATISADNENVSYWVGEDPIQDPINHVFDEAATINVTVKYGEKEAPMQLTVIPPLVNLTATYTGGEIAKDGKIQGDKLRFTVTCEDGSTLTIAPDDENISYWVDGKPIEDPINYEFKDAGQYEVTVKYKGQETVMTLTVADDAPTPSASASATSTATATPSATATPTATATAETSDGGLSIGAIVGIVGAVIVLGVIGAFIFGKGKKK